MVGRRKKIGHNTVQETSPANYFSYSWRCQIKNYEDRICLGRGAQMNKICIFLFRNNRVSLFFFLLICMVLMSSHGYADQCAYFSKDTALEALKHLKQGTTIFEFCETCGDTEKTPIKIETVWVIQKDDRAEIQINGKPIDLANIYIPYLSLRNFASMVKCPTGKVSEYIPLMSIAQAQSALSSAPAPAEAPAPAPERPAEITENETEESDNALPIESLAPMEIPKYIPPVQIPRYEPINPIPYIPPVQIPRYEPINPIPYIPPVQIPRFEPIRPIEIPKFENFRMPVRGKMIYLTDGTFVTGKKIENKNIKVKTPDKEAEISIDEISYIYKNIAHMSKKDTDGKKKVYKILEKEISFIKDDDTAVKIPLENIMFLTEYYHNEGETPRRIKIIYNSGSSPELTTYSGSPNAKTVIFLLDEYIADTVFAISKPSFNKSRNGSEFTLTLDYVKQKQFSNQIMIGILATGGTQDKRQLEVLCYSPIQDISHIDNSGKVEARLDCTKDFKGKVDMDIFIVPTGNQAMVHLDGQIHIENTLSNVLRNSLEVE
jgi:hypothetical protein